MMVGVHDQERLRGKSESCWLSFCGGDMLHHFSLVVCPGATAKDWYLVGVRASAAVALSHGVQFLLSEPRLFCSPRGARRAPALGSGARAHHQLGELLAGVFE